MAESLTAASVPDSHGILHDLIEDTNAVFVGVTTKSTSQTRPGTVPDMISTKATSSYSGGSAYEDAKLHHFLRNLPL